MKPGMNSNQAPHNQSLVSSQQLQQQQQQQQVQQQRVAVNHGQGGGQQQVDQYGRPVPQQHSGKGQLISKCPFAQWISLVYRRVQKIEQIEPDHCDRY